MDILVIASNNDGKIREFKKLLSEFPLNIIAQPNNLEVEETGQSFSDNAIIKAKTVAKYTGQISIADDSGLCVKCLDGAPGIFSSRYAKTDKERVSKLLNNLKDCDDRRAYFLAALCIASPNGDVLFEVEGRCDGLISYSPRGINGFGYDPIFEVKGMGLTFSEMEPTQKKKYSHRAKAFEKLIPRLKEIYNFF